MVELDQSRVTEWPRADGIKVLTYHVDFDEVASHERQLRAAIDAGMRIVLSTEGVDRGPITLSVLRPLIGEIRDLYVLYPGRVTDVETLNGAQRLTWLQFETGSAEGRAHLASLPHLEEFAGRITRATASALLNPSLRYLSVSGAIPKSFARVAGPVEVFFQEGGRSQTELPVFAQPEAMRSIFRIGPARFDLRQLSEMTNLADFKLNVCDDLVGITALAQLPHLSNLRLNGVTTREEWADLPHVATASLRELSPYPSISQLQAWRERGWIVPQDPPAAPAETLTVEQVEDEELWAVYMWRFADLGAAAEEFDGMAAHGIHGEKLILGVVAELRAEGAKLKPEADSESGLTAVYFPDRAQAEQVYTRAQAALHADTATKLAYLRAGRKRS